MNEREPGAPPGEKTPVPALRRQGEPPYAVCLVHGGPGAFGSLASLRRELARDMGVIEAMSREESLEGQERELEDILRQEADGPVVLAGHSFGAMLSLLVAARAPELVSRLILIGSGPLTEKDARDIDAVRLSRLAPDARAERDRLVRRLGDPGLDPGSAGADGLMARLGALIMRADAWDPLPGAMAPDPEAFACGFAVMRAAWPQMRRLRASGGLLEAAGRLRAPVSVIHGDYDPHPADGVAGPLLRVRPETRVFVLKHCGHEPWLERGARWEFYRILRREIALKNSMS